jgi:hypothetical protein
LRRTGGLRRCQRNRLSGDRDRSDDAECFNDPSAPDLVDSQWLTNDGDPISSGGGLHDRASAAGYKHVSRARLPLAVDAVPPSPLPGRLLRS